MKVFFWDCNRCNFKAAYPSGLSEHKKYQHGVNIDKKHKCSECGKLFHKRRQLTIHFRIHSGERPHQCQFCEQRFRRSVSQWHWLGFRKKNHDQKIKCEHCGFISENQDILTLHTLSHQMSLVDIMNNLPTSIKEESFKSEEEFLAALKGFLKNNSVPIFNKSPSANLKVKCNELECNAVIKSRGLRKTQKATS